jgi:hypothetical protein
VAASSVRRGCGADAGDAALDAHDAKDANEALAADAGTCDPSVVTFPAGGSLQVGQLCDDVLVCVADAAQSIDRPLS